MARKKQCRVGRQAGVAGAEMLPRVFPLFARLAADGTRRDRARQVPFNARAPLLDRLRASSVHPAMKASVRSIH